MPAGTSTLSQPFTGAYPERTVPRENWLDRVGVAVAGPVVRWTRSRRARVQRFVAAVGRHGDKLKNLSENELTDVAEELRKNLRRRGIENDRLTAQSFALVRELAQRKFDMCHYDVQLIGGWTLLQGMLAEMEAGEGKTLTATLPACTAALAGLPVHIVTVNDYLASRDAALMKPLYEALGLTVGTIIQGMSPDERRRAYACDITYCTNKEIAFDYLKDRITLGGMRSRTQLQLERLYGKDSRLQRLLLRGLCFAIVDEADSVLVDEARTPLIISGAGNVEDEGRFHEQALAIAEELVEIEHFRVLGRERRVELTDNGKLLIKDLSEPLGGLWTGTQRREEFVRQALAAQHIYLRDKHYLVKEGKVQIIDEYTGRVMPDRSWEQGLHQMIETKESCELTQRRETLARMSYQRFFRRYIHLSGMTGTAQEVASELWSVYRLNVVVVPTNKPSRRAANRVEIRLTADQKWDAITQHVKRTHAEQQPILIGTRSVEASEHLSRLLSSEGLDHQVLNARQDEAEAEIVARAGEVGRITVATNMAGRGTDIKLGPGAAALGGLHVVVTELHEAKRIDRQLIGRCARQGDPGTYKAILSFEDELLQTHTSAFRRILGTTGMMSSTRVLEFAMRTAQRSAERLHSRMRRDLLKMDEQLETALAFSGHAE